MTSRDSQSDSLLICNELKTCFIFLEWSRVHNNPGNSSYHYTPQQLAQDYERVRRLVGGEDK